MARAGKSFALLTLLAAVGCGSSSGTGATGTGGSGGGPANPASGLPEPAQTGVAKPAGAPGGLTVLDWAGFTSAVSWTFDDSQPSQIAHYAELAAVGIPMTFYISTGNSSESGYDATFSQAVADGSEIGNHTVHHCMSDLTGCSFGTADATLAQELDDCSAYITSHYPAQGGAWTAASPFGDTGYDSLDMTRFLVNRGVGGGTIGAGTGDSTDPFNLPIYLAQPADTAAIFSSQIDSAHAAGRWLILLVHTITPTDQNWYNPVAITDVTGGMSHGKSLADVWNDSVVHVAAYWRAQKLFAGLTPATSGGTTTWTWTLPANFPPKQYLRVTVTGGTLAQGATKLAWDEHGFYEVALDAGTLTLSP
ncbi:MAG TPA: polysaccharide deacetylase family protein [Polyangia bacterium]|nr:polysaccharide deacetylase family protein [Polyangia bacterium]